VVISAGCELACLQGT